MPFLSGMDATQALSAFVIRALTPERASRYSGLTGSEKGRRKLLGYLAHDFERSIRPNVKRGIVDRKAQCFAYHSSVDFGEQFPSVAEAYERLDSDDGWLIVVSDGSAGIYRPEAHWDAEIEIIG
jgi:hypothetical protein